MKNFRLFLLLSFLPMLCFTQYTQHKLLTVGYEYQNGSFLELGGKLLFLKKDEIMYRVGASALLGKSEGKMLVLPKIQGDVLFNFEKNLDIHQSFYYLAGLETTHRYIVPKIGISVFGVLEFSAGYGFPFSRQEPQLGNGLNLNVGLHLPLPFLKDIL